MKLTRDPRESFALAVVPTNSEDAKQQLLVLISVD